MKPINRALRRAKKISMATTYKAKCNAVHAWHKSIMEMLLR